MADVSQATDSATRRRIADAVGRLDLGETEAWSDLDLLSARTQVDRVEVFETDIKIADGRFEGLVNVHCTLEFGEGGDAFTTSETFPGRFEGTMSADGPAVSRLTVDTASFYA